MRKFCAECLVPTFPAKDERASLQSIQECVRLKEESKYGANNYHVIVAYEGDEPIAGSIFDYLARPYASAIEFLLVSPGQHRAGLASRLLCDRWLRRVRSVC